ncbi:MAG: tRNA 4-thiouridine(8) synthase ThiI [Candidatus Dadabacteria bacterium]|nr:tRNA 4-thiouridine(8) synthase ThiI [Candidatus Dadabacteria bacterium]NIQ17004.1 tRNA 4-thiouridine(8) synthase ThiI [Candidatus Dadabacteria bacterium]
MKGILVHYGELALKGNNRSVFEKILRKNIEKTAGGKAVSCEGIIFCESTDISKLNYVFGISSYSDCVRVKKDLKVIVAYILKEIESKAENVKTFGVFVKRSDKGFKYNSVEVGRIVGSEIQEKFNLEVDLKNPDLPVYIEIADYAFIHFKKIKGLGGLPMGVSGRLLSLLSGGIDSPVASNQMMRRGCEVDFIHFHAFSGNKEALESKITEFVKILKQYQYSTFIYFVPYKFFHMALLNTKLIESYELVMFRRFMILLAEKIALKNGYKGIVLGDNLGQVASQTLENIYASRFDCKVPIFQPLISLDKDEIVKKSREIGTYDLSIVPYKECCSLVSNNPKTRAKLETVMHYSEKMGLNDIVDKTIDSIEKIVV